MSTLFIYSLFTRFPAIFCSHSSVFKLKLKNPRRENPSGQIILIIFFLIQHWPDNFMNYTKSFREQFILIDIYMDPINIVYSSWNSQTLKAVSHFEAFWLHLLASILGIWTSNLTDNLIYNIS